MKKSILTLLWMLAATVGAMAGNVLSIVEMDAEKEQKGGSSHVWVHFPTGADSPTRRAVIYFIFHSMHFYLEADMEYPPLTCDEQTFRSFLDDYTEALCQVYSTDQQEYAAECAASGEVYDVPWYRNISLLKVAETDHYVSYACYDGEFCGGAHDNRGSIATTIRKSDGVALDDIFIEDADDSDQLQAILWKYLIATEETDQKEFAERIGDFLEANYGNRERLHLPGDSMYLAPDGVHLLYAPLEICFWDMGEIEVVIPYDAAKPYLTPEAARLANAASAGR